MKILVTGGAGFIASHIVDAYIQDGHEVVVADNLCTGRKENLNPKAKFYKVDICHPGIEEIFEKEKPNVLNHHAAQINTRKSIDDPRFDCQVNISGFLNLMEAARKTNVEKIIFASSGGAVYGEQIQFPADENHPTNPVNPYGVAKLSCEKYLRFYQVYYEIPFIALRYANVYGPRQNFCGDAGVVATFISKMLENKSPVINGDGKQTRDYVYVDDVVEINKRALRAKECGLFNLGTGHETSVLELFSILRDVMNVDIEAQHAAAKVGEQLRSAIDSSLASKNFGYRPHTSMVEGLKKTVDWFQNFRLV